MEAKRCGACGLDKPITSFTKRSGRSGRRGTCRSCQRKRGRRETGAHEGEAGSAMPGEVPREQYEDGIVQPAERGVRLSEDGRESAGVRPDIEDGSSKATPSSNASAGADEPEPVTAGAALISADDDLADTAAESGEPAKRRKRKRRRRKKRGAEPIEPVPLAPQDERGHAGDPEGTLIPPLAGSEPSDGERDVAPAPHAEEEPPARKKKRRRRRRKSKAKPVQTSALPSGGERAEAEWLHPDEDDDESTIVEEDESADGIEAIGGEETPSRKRKRRRRRKRKAGVDTVPAPARPQVRPPYKRIVPIRGPFKYDVGLLNDRGTGLIRLRGRRETGKRWSTEIPTEMAIRMVSEGAAGIINPSLIHKLYTKTDFRLLILQRDDYVCKYCGRFGDTIDHVMPKSKGGLSTPDNCVCACAECNLKKADHLDFVFDDF